MVVEAEMQNKKILLIDDEIQLLCLLEDVLRKEGFINIEKESSGIDGIIKTKEFKPDVILLDINLPDIDGYMVFDKIRSFSTVPIIFLTALGEDENKIKGLELGAEDYVTKPFNIKEIVLRVKIQLKRRIKEKIEDSKPEKIIRFGNIVINEERGEILKDGQSVSLTAKEYQILVFLANNANKIFSKTTLCEKVWGLEYDGYDNAVMVHIRHLREKIEDDPSKPNYIKTLKGIGYKLVV